MNAVRADVTPAFVRRVLQRAAKVPEVAARLAQTTVSVAVRITSAQELLQLNQTFADEDHTTDVLSFEGEGDHLGDIAISWPAVVEQAELWDHDERSELGVLLVHGLLHLLGWDHGTTAESEEMWRLTYIALAGLRRSPRA